MGLAEVFRTQFTSLGGKIAAEQSYVAGDTEFRPQLTAIKAANPDVIFVPGFYTEVGQIAQQARELGINVPMVGGDGWDAPALLDIGKEALNGYYFSDHYFFDEPRPAVQRFVAAIREKYHQNPAANAALGYDALHILADAITASGGPDKKAIRDRIASTKDYQGVSGVITMGADRDPIKPVAMIRIDGGKTQFAGWITP